MTGNKNIPTWLQPYLQESQIAEIESKIAELEKLTHAEIVAVVVRRSTPSFAAHGLLLLILLCLAGLLVEISFLTFWLSIYERVSLVAVALFLSAFSFSVLGKNPWVMNILTSKKLLRHSAMQRAKLEFYENKLTQTADRSGVIFMVSLEDHQAVVWMDSDKVELQNPEIWAQVVRELIQGAKQKNLGAGFLKAIEKAEPLFREHLPVLAGQANSNQLSNQLVIRD